jgi:hypothetical protein
VAAPLRMLTYADVCLKVAAPLRFIRAALLLQMQLDCMLTYADVC